MHWIDEEMQGRRLSAAAHTAVEEILPTVMRNPTETQKTIARIVALSCFTKNVTDDDVIETLFDVRSCVKSDAIKVRNALRPILGEFLTLAHSRMAEVV